MKRSFFNFIEEYYQDKKVVGAEVGVYGCVSSDWWVIKE